MCYNCGCKIKNDQMGKGHVHEKGGSLTEDTFAHMAKIWGMPIGEVKKNTLDLLKEELEEKK